MNSWSFSYSEIFRFFLDDFTIVKYSYECEKGNDFFPFKPDL